MILRGQRGVVRNWPIVPGIDFAGVVRHSHSKLFSEGDAVVLTGNKAGQHFDGGFSERATCQAEWLVPIPPTFDTVDAMTIGSAGFTAMQCISNLEVAGGIRPGDGRILVTGAAGGLGQMAITLLAAKGYEVVASTGRIELGAHLTRLGASEVIGRLPAADKPLAAQLWSGVIDSVGGSTLAAALASTSYRGAIASAGVAGGGILESTVYPFILRGVRLLGVDATLPWNVQGFPADPALWRKWRKERLELWAELAALLTTERLALMRSRCIGLDELRRVADAIVVGKVAGRVVVKV